MLKVKQIITLTSGRIFIIGHDTFSGCRKTFADVGNPICGFCKFEGTAECEGLYTCKHHDKCIDCSYKTECEGPLERHPEKVLYDGHSDETPFKLLDLPIDRIRVHRVKRDVYIGIVVKDGGS